MRTCSLKHHTSVAYSTSTLELGPVSDMSINATLLEQAYGEALLLTGPTHYVGVNVTLRRKLLMAPMHNRHHH